MIFHQISRTELPSRFFIAEDYQNDISTWLDVRQFHAQECSQHHRHTSFHIECPTSPHVAIDDSTFERRICPLLMFSRHNIDVTVQHQWRRGSITTEARDQIRTL